MTFLQDNLVAYTGPKKMEVVYFLLIKHPMRIRNEMVRSSGTMIMTYFLKVIYIFHNYTKSSASTIPDHTNIENIPLNLKM